MSGKVQRSVIEWLMGGYSGVYMFYTTRNCILSSVRSAGRARAGTSSTVQLTLIALTSQLSFWFGNAKNLAVANKNDAQNNIHRTILDKSIHKRCSSVNADQIYQSRWRARSNLNPILKLLLNPRQMELPTPPPTFCLFIFSPPQLFEMYFYSTKTKENIQINNKQTTTTKVIAKVSFVMIIISLFTLVAPVG